MYVQYATDHPLFLGGQYLDGTTDVTRTFHYGDPTDFEKEVYTRVLMGSIDLARATFMDGTPDTRLDILARWNLFKVGLNYRHGTGHGIGAYGFIHESPIQVLLLYYYYISTFWSFISYVLRFVCMPQRNIQ